MRCWKPRHRGPRRAVRAPKKRDHLEPAGRPRRCVQSRTRAIGARLGVRGRTARAERAVGTSAQVSRTGISASPVSAVRRKDRAQRSEESIRSACSCAKSPRSATDSASPSQNPRSGARESSWSSKRSNLDQQATSPARQTSRATRFFKTLRRSIAGTTALIGAGIRPKYASRTRGQFSSSAQRAATTKPLSEVSASSSQSHASGVATKLPGARSSTIARKIAVESGMAFSPTRSTGTCPVVFSAW